ncbi:hypothetical protein ARMSODRAFT_974246 [Armillaria solidipes]|uniref:Uncharacterized protein n=1 Tax=Armillaria solidipes TaxID=1076256 RepID=A0A2H3BJL8_9AGAR|nr:hypothetical protein ARMSODRAFT_974246 [Armillaria solidipes]
MRAAISRENRQLKRVAGIQIKYECLPNLVVTANDKINLNKMNNIITHTFCKGGQAYGILAQSIKTSFSILGFNSTVVADLLNDSLEGSFSEAGLSNNRSNGKVFPKDKKKMALSNIGIVHHLVNALHFLQNLEEDGTRRNIISLASCIQEMINTYSATLSLLNTTEGNKDAPLSSSLGRTNTM